MIKKYDLSVCIPARNEEFLKRTVEGVLKNRKAKTEIIVTADGNWPDPPLEDHKDLVIIYHNKPVGQRVALNEAARLSRSKYIMKLDAHCIVDEGFDKVLIDSAEKLGPKVTQVPRMYNLHAFNWRCKKCGNEWYQGPQPKHCMQAGESRKRNEKCDGKEFERVMVWKPRWNRKSDHYRFDKNLKFQYWGSLGKRPESKGDITETMSLLGACFFMNRERYLQLGGSDEKHGGWGQQGTEIACMTWLSGGRVVTNRKTWFAHMFRTQGGAFGFPYALSGSQVSKARNYSQKKWTSGNWKHQKRSLEWLIERFAPVPGWPVKKSNRKGIVFYTDNRLELKIAHKVQRQLESIGLPIVSASLKPMDFGDKNIHLNLKRGYLTMFKQILSGLKASKAEIVFFCEHDVLYHPSHFNFTPNRNDVYYYNTNVWKLNREKGYGLKVNNCKQTSGLCAYRDLLIKHYEKRIRIVEKEGFTRRMGFEPGTHSRRERVDDYKAENWESKYPNVDIRHDSTLTKSRWSKDQFRNKKFTKGWTESKEIPGWGKANEII